jgi:hypothetical protein
MESQIFSSAKTPLSKPALLTAQKTLPNDFSKDHDPTCRYHQLNKSSRNQYCCQNAPSRTSHAGPL